MGEELEVFKEIWKERAHKSQVSGELLRGADPNVWFFSHILPKSTYRRFKCNKDNILLMTPKEHFQWEHKKSSLIGHKQWVKVFELRDWLVKQYNGV